MKQADEVQCVPVPYMYVESELNFADLGLITEKSTESKWVKDYHLCNNHNKVANKTFDR